MSCNTTLSLNHRKIISGALTRTELKTQLYHYDKLEGSNDIRLVVLPPGSFYSSVRCDIIHVDLAEAPDYEALSYTWAGEDGDRSLTGAILCGPDDQWIPITRNCEAALRHLRLERETRVLWVDAICINQTTLEERNHQVSIMSKIYRTASRVVVYLGEATRDSDEFIHLLNNKIYAYRSIQQAKLMLRRRWFKRLWVFQEITLARRAVVMCGDKTVQWRTLVEFYNMPFYRTHNSTNMHVSDNPSFANILLHYGLKGAQAIETLPKLFRATQQGDASDPRDKVFALLGIGEKDSHHQMVPDYGLSEMETFENLATYFVKRFGIVFLRSIFHGTSSWVFYWSHHTPRDPIHVGNSTSVAVENGVNILTIRGQRVISGFAMSIYGISRKYSVGIRVNNGIIQCEGYGFFRKQDVLVRVSEYHCVILRLLSYPYQIVGGAGAVQNCESHDNNSQCGPDCSPTEIKLKSVECFIVS